MMFEVCPDCNAQMVLAACDKYMWCNRCNKFFLLPDCPSIIETAKRIRYTLYADMNCPHCFGRGRRKGTGMASGTIIDCGCFMNRAVMEALNQYRAGMNQECFRKEYLNEP